MTLRDSHIHLFADGYPGRYGRLFPKGHELSLYQNIRNFHGIDQALVVGFEGAPWARGNNRYLAELAKDHSWIIPLAFTSSASPLQAEKLTVHWNKGFYGISLYIPDIVAAKILAVAPEKWVRNLNTKRAIVSVNCPASVAMELSPLWKRLNEAQIMFSHLGLPGPIAQAAQNLSPLLTLSRLPHVGVKLSGAYGINAYPHPGIKKLLTNLQDTYGEDRLYWGSDYSPAMDQVSFEQTISVIANSLKPHLPKFMGGNLAVAISRVNRAA